MGTLDRAKWMLPSLGESAHELPSAQSSSADSGLEKTIETEKERMPLAEAALEKTPA